MSLLRTKVVSYILRNPISVQPGSEPEIQIFLEPMVISGQCCKNEGSGPGRPMGCSRPGSTPHRLLERIKATSAQSCRTMRGTCFGALDEHGRLGFENDIVLTTPQSHEPSFGKRTKSRDCTIFTRRKVVLTQRLRRSCLDRPWRSTGGSAK